MSDFPARILVATDGSEDAELGVRAAISLAQDTDAELHVVHVGQFHRVYLPATPGPPPPSDTPEAQEEIKRAAQGLLNEQVEQIKQAGGDVAEAHLRVGKPAEEILRLSEDITAGLIVMGNQGFGGKFSRMRRFVMGTVSEEVTRYARCSVMVVRRDLYDRPSA